MTDPVCWQLRSRHLLEKPLSERAIIELGEYLLAAVAELAGHVRELYYAVMLSGHACPSCDGPLKMIREGRCACRVCEYAFDPTLMFQACPDCSGTLQLRVCRYTCRHCGRDVRSHFLFDGRAFDPAYFREKMAASRQRRQARREQLRALLAGTRSPAVELGPAEADGLAALQTALDALTRTLPPTDTRPKTSDFDLHRYETHVRQACAHGEVKLTAIARLIEDPRRDLVYRFIALVFLAHAGVVRIRQTGRDILVIPT